MSTIRTLSLRLPAKACLLVVMVFGAAAPLRSVPGGEDSAPVRAFENPTSVGGIWPLEPLGPDFGIKSFDFGGFGSSTAMSRTGEFVAAWQTPFCCISARGVDESGQFVGGDWQLFSFSDGTFDPIGITSRVSGDFVLAWEGDSPGYFEQIIGARRFMLDGTPKGELVEIANNSDGSKSIHPAVDEWHPGADFLVTWAKAAPARSDFDILIRAEPLSNVVQGDFLVSTYTTGDQLNPSLAVGADSSFVVVWRSEGSPGSDADGLSVQARWFSPGGSAGEQFQVNDFTTGDQDVPEVAMADDGHFLVVWDGLSAGPDPDLSIQGRLYGPDAVPLGPDFQINSETMEGQTDPVVVHRSDGSFLVAWRSTPGVWGRIVDSSGRPMGLDQRLNSTMEGGYQDPNVASNGSGSFVVTWVANDDSYYARGRRARLFRELVFKDGFESGDTSNWSEVVP